MRIITIPFIKLFFWVKKLYNRLFFKLERQLINGTDQTLSEKPSIIFYSLPRSGSTFMENNLIRLCAFNDLQRVNIAYYLAKAKPKERYTTIFEESFWKKTFREKGYMFGVNRNFFPITNDPSFKSLLFIRDPRDVITSTYYSLKYSHENLNYNIYSLKKRVQKQEINEYVLNNYKLLLDAYLNYIQQVTGKPNLLIVRYEDIVKDFPSYFQKICDHLKLTDNQEEIDKIIKETNFNVSEDKSKHKRQAQPGDHQRKLKPETIEFLNEKFSTVLKEFNYL